MYDRGKCVKVSPLIINDYLGRRKSAGSDKAPSIYKIMTKEKEVEEEEEARSKEEEETASDDKEEHYVGTPKYNETMELIGDAQLLKKMLNDISGYPKLTKEFVVKNYGITLGLLNFNCKLFVWERCLRHFSSQCSCY